MILKDTKGPRETERRKIMEKQVANETEEILSVEEIMEAIRQKIGAGEGYVDESRQQMAASHLPAELYEHLEEVRLSYDKIQPMPLVLPPSVPVIGGVLASIQQRLHELVLYYVNQLAANQIRVNAHLLRAVEILVEEAEKVLETNQKHQDPGKE
jgi:hypothetical protein